MSAPTRVRSRTYSASEAPSESDSLLSSSVLSFSVSSVVSGAARP